MNESNFPRHEFSVLHFPQTLNLLASRLEKASEAVEKAKTLLRQLRTTPPSCLILLCHGQVLLVEKGRLRLARLEGAPIARPDEFEPNSYAVVRVPLSSWEAPVQTHERSGDDEADCAEAPDPLEAVWWLGQILFWPQLALEQVSEAFLERVGAPEDWLHADTEVELTFTGGAAIALQFSGSSVEVNARDSVRVDESGPVRELSVPDTSFTFSVYGFEVGVEAAVQEAVK